MFDFRSEMCLGCDTYAPLRRFFTGVAYLVAKRPLNEMDISTKIINEIDKSGNNRDNLSLCSDTK